MNRISTVMREGAERASSPCSLPMWASSLQPRRALTNLAMPAACLGLSASRTVRNKLLLFKPPSLWDVITAAQTD